MKEITKILPLNEAAKFQKSAGKYDCTITELAVMGAGKTRISISGTEENLDLLVSSIENENKETTSV